jgi:hypothetical protein
MVKRAGDHRQTRARLLIKRPEAQVIAAQVLLQSPDCRCKQFPSFTRSGRQKKIVHAPCCPDKSIQDVSWRRHNILLEPQVTLWISKGNPASLSATNKTAERSGGSVQVFAIAALGVSAREQGDSLTLRETGIPGCLKTAAVIPIKVMIPDRQSRGIRLEVLAKPIACQKKLAFSGRISGFSKEAQIPESPLCDRDGVVLNSNCTAIIQQRNTCRIVRSGIERFPGKSHVVLPETSRLRSWIDFSRIVPETELTVPGQEISAEDPAVVFQFLQC